MNRYSKFNARVSLYLENLLTVKCESIWNSTLTVCKAQNNALETESDHGAR